MSKTDISARILPDGTVVRVDRDGAEAPFPAAPMRPMTEAEVAAAAAADPDAGATTPEAMAEVRLLPRIRTLRRALSLTQEEFAARYRIPLGTLRDWEQGRAEPDQTARAHLRAIAGDAEAVQHALSAGPRQG